MLFSFLFKSSAEFGVCATYKSLRYYSCSYFAYSPDSPLSGKDIDAQSSVQSVVARLHLSLYELKA